MGLDLFFSKTRTDELGYFRKVNFLVKYFKDIGFDVDNQIPLEINKKDAEDLLNRCNLVLEEPDKAPELLPTMDGFFFGSTDYNEYYLYTVKKVRDFLKDILIPEFNNLDENEQITFTTWY